MCPQENIQEFNKIQLIIITTFNKMLSIIEKNRKNLIKFPMKIQLSRELFRMPMYLYNKLVGILSLDIQTTNTTKLTSLNFYNIILEYK